MLSPRKINIKGSPAKENKGDYKSYSKQQLIGLIIEYDSFLSKSGIKFSENNKVSNDSPKKEIKLIKKSSSIGSESENQMRRLKIKINDYQFQLKKIEEDYAEFKVKSRLEKEKQIKKLNDQIIKLRKEISEDNGRWEKKFEERDLLYQEQRDSYKKMVDKISKEQIQRIQNIYQVQVKQLKEKLKDCEEEFQKQYENEIYLLKKENQVKIEKIQENHEEEKKIVIVKHKEVVKKIEVKDEQKILALESQVKVEKNKHEQSKMQFNKVKEKLYTDLYYVRKDKQELNKIISDLKKDIINLKFDYEQKEKQVHKIQENYALKIKKVEELNQSNLSNLRSQSNQSRLNILKAHKKQIQKFEFQIQEMHRHKESLVQVWKVANQEVQKKFEERPARQEDTELMQKQSYQIIIREEELRKIKEDLRVAKMERENNQKNYNRIFSANGARDRKNQPPGGMSKERIFKQANTVDMSLLLKVCNKNF